MAKKLNGTKIAQQMLNDVQSKSTKTEQTDLTAKTPRKRKPKESTFAKEKQTEELKLSTPKVKKVEPKTIQARALSDEDTLENIWEKERRHAEALVRQLNKRGYSIDVSTVLSLPNVLDLKYKDLYNYATYTYPNGEVITASEHIHRTRSEGAKRGYVTRTANKQMQEVSSNIAQEIQTDTYYPNLDIIAKVRSDIENLQQLIGGEWTDKFIVNRKSELLSIFDDNLMSVDEQTYANYLLQNEDKIAPLLNVIIYDSNQENVAQAFNELAILLNMGSSLTQSQSENLSIMGEHFMSVEE